MQTLPMQKITRAVVENFDVDRERVVVQIVEADPDQKSRGGILYSERQALSPEEIMIEEVADLRIQPDQQQAFEAAIHHGVTTVISRSRGFQGYGISRSIETPTRYLLKIQWATLEDHTVGFRESPLFTQWRAIVSPFFAAPPAVEHFVLTDKTA